MITEWIRDDLPAPLSNVGPLGVMYWQYLLVPWVFLFALGLATLTTAIIGRITLRLTKLTHAKWDDLLVENLQGPARLLFTGLFGWVLLPLIEIHGPFEDKLIALMRMLMLLAGFWGLLRAVDIAHEATRASQWVTTRPAVLPVLVLANRIAKIAIGGIGVVTALQQLGYPVAGILAGLGVGGLAVALAAQKTLENFLGSVMLSVDQPLRVGALVNVEGVTGVVEAIGLRSTRIRTFARTIVTLPNGKLADAKIEDFAARERIQLNFTFGVLYSTSKAQLEAIIADVRAFLREHRVVFKDGVFVHFKELGQSSLDIEVNTWLVLGPDDDFRDQRQEILLTIMGIVETHGSGFAFPTRTIVIDKPVAA